MEPVAKYTGLMRRGGTHTYRVKVPTDVVDLVNANPQQWRILTGPTGSKREDWAKLRSKKGGGIKLDIWIALDGETKAAKAASLAKLKAVEMDALFDEVRRTFAGIVQPVALSALDEAEVRKLAFLYLRRQEQAFLKVQDVTATPAERIALLEEDIAAASDPDDPSMLASIQQQGRRVLVENGISVDTSAPQFGWLCRLIREAMVEHAQRARERVATDTLSTRHLNPTFEGIDSDSTIDKPKAKLTVRELIDDYAALLKAEGKSTKTINGYAVGFNLLKELMGSKAVAEVTRDDCQRVRSIMENLPPQSVRDKQCPGMSLEQAAEYAKAKGMETLSPTTVLSYVHNLSAIFNWAETEGKCAKNPAKALIRTNSKVKLPRKRAPRMPFEVKELNAMFRAPLYVGCEDDERGYAVPGPARPRRGRFWVPILGLFGGLRLNEACQLHVSDVRKIGGHPCILITEDTDGDPDDQPDDSDRKRVKTEAGQRFVTVHPTLIRLGFLEHVEKMKEAGSTRLFPDLPAGKSGYFSDPFSKWFNGKDRFLDKLKLKRRGLCFHSLRHNYRDALHDAEVPDKYACLLGGWVSPAVQGSDKDYGQGLLVKRLTQEIAKLRYVDANTGEELDLSHLYVDEAEEVT